MCSLITKILISLGSASNFKINTAMDAEQDSQTNVPTTMANSKQ